MADNTWTRLGQMMKSRLERELFLSFWLRTYGCLSTYRRRYPGVFPFLQYASCFIKGRKIHRFWTWKSTGRPWSRPDLFKTETTSRQNSRCKVRQPAFLKISHQWMVRWFVQNAIIYTCWSSGTYITVWQKHWSKYLKPFSTDEHEESGNILQWWILERHQSVQWQSPFLLQMPTLSQL